MQCSRSAEKLLAAGSSPLLSLLAFSLPLRACVLQAVLWFAIGGVFWERSGFVVVVVVVCLEEVEEEEEEDLRSEL